MVNMSDSDVLKNLLSEDPHHIYSDEELDAIEEIDPTLALRIARAQHFAKPAEQRVVDENAEIDPVLLEKAIEDVRRILSLDGGDIELVNIEDHTVRVRMKGACVGCPNAVLDLKNVVEKIIFEQVPGVRVVENTF